MCGIFGTTETLSDGRLEEVFSLLQHRGPDSCGHVVVDSSPLLVHTRLAIQDLSPSGHQPMTSRDGRWSITYNGELYNHPELRKRLEGPFRSTSDTETLIEYVAAFGVDAALRDINGIYAFALFDRQEKRLYVVRDPFGVKPVYYTDGGGGLTFSSDVKPILRVRGQPARLDRHALQLFLSLRFVPSPRTLFEGIRRLPPGHVLIHGCASGETTMKRYVEPTRGRFEGSVREASDAYHACLRDAVGRQLISDVPVGILLSAGIDSAVIAALAREHNDSLTAFTVGFGPDYVECEAEGAAETARILDIPHEVVTVNPVDLIESLGEIVAAVEEPLGTTSIMPMWYLTQLARRHATVVLAGQGSDEPWGGYRRYKIELIMDALPFLKHRPFSLLSGLGAAASSDALRRAFSCLGVSSDASRFLRAYELFSPAELRAFGVDAEQGAVDSIEYWLAHLEGVGPMSGAERMMRTDTRMNLADDLLLYGDKVSMAYALEARVPMLDREVISFIEQLPLHMRTTLTRTKIVHREMAASYLPASIINRPKQGFPVPFGTWCRTVWREFVADHLLDPRREIANHLDAAGISEVWERHLAGRFDYSRQLFALLTLSLWMERFL